MVRRFYDCFSSCIVSLPNPLQFQLPVHCLSVHRGVPVRVVEDDCVGACQVHANASRSRRRNEQKDARVGVELIYKSLAILHLQRSEGNYQQKVKQRAPDIPPLISCANAGTRINTLNPEP